MAKVVTGEQYVGIDGKLHEIKRQLRQPNGYPYDPERLNHALQAIVEGRFAVDLAKSEFPSSAIAAEYGYTVVEDVAPVLKSVGDLELLGFLREGESALPGEEMRKRAVEAKANLGLVDLKFVLAHQAEIPAEMSQFYIIFSGTLLWGSDGGAVVAYLRWRDDRWIVRFDGVALGWFDSVRFARSK